ncbi:MAG TPA: Asp-tRNA(Asn)/Glu-tRNA(Gln) amidotransferase subunit GatC [Flavobacteriales bacterium]|nr:Asp-tRNA(Asn)/Glu-tRNA(Gln) amidotransferase subunit GatC [Flavobacteriales bacterium]
MKLDEKMVDKIAELSKLEFNKNEKEAILEDMNKMLIFIDKLNEIDTDDVEPLIHMTHEINVLREDDAENTISQQEALKNAPSKDSTYFKIPKVLDK